MAKIAEQQDWANASAEQVAAVDAEVAADFGFPSVSEARFLPELLTPCLKTPEPKEEWEWQEGPYGTWTRHMRHRVHLMDLRGEGAGILMQDLLTAKLAKMRLEERVSDALDVVRMLKDDAGKDDGAADEAYKRGYEKAKAEAAAEPAGAAGPGAVYQTEWWKKEVERREAAAYERGYQKAKAEADAELDEAVADAYERGMCAERTRAMESASEHEAVEPPAAALGAGPAGAVDRCAAAAEPPAGAKAPPAKAPPAKAPPAKRAKRAPAGAKAPPAKKAKPAPAGAKAPPAKAEPADTYPAAIDLAAVARAEAKNEGSTAACRKQSARNPTRGHHPAAPATPPAEVTAAVLAALPEDMRKQAEGLSEPHMRDLKRLLEGLPGCQIHTEWPRQRVSDLEKAWHPSTMLEYKHNQEAFKSFRLKANGAARLGAEASEERRYEGISLRLLCNSMACEAHRMVKSGHAAAVGNAMGLNDQARVRLARMVRQLKAAMQEASSCVSVLEQQEEQLQVLQD
jgi:hypothetical protein